VGQTLPHYVQEVERCINNDCSRESSPRIPTKSNSIYQKANMWLSCVLRVCAGLKEVEDIWAEDRVQEQECLQNNGSPELKYTPAN
jgi:hypothetical protein